MTSNVQTVQELYRAFQAKDYEAFLAICNPDLQWIQNAGFPRGATWHGAQAVVDGVFRSFDTSWKDWGFDIEQFLDAGNSVIVVGTYRGQHKVSGRLFVAPAAHVYDLANGKITRFRQFTDTKVICDAIS